MSKYIDADALIGNLEAALAVYKRNAKYDEALLPYIKELKQELKIANSAPSIELIRCKDCVHWQLLTSPFGLCVWNEDNKRQMEETGFCSCGVKR